MLLLDLIHLMDANVAADASKVHLATWNGEDDPLDVYLAGNFPEWQRWQAKKNFERKYVISLIALPEKNQWLFAGVHLSTGCEWQEDKKAFYYALEAQQSCSEFDGRLVVSFARPGRQPYLLANSHVDRMHVAEIRPERMQIAEFPGFKAIDLSRSELQVIVKQGLVSWRIALSNVAGVYLISDTASGKLYVGSATGEGGIWTRWSQYATSHGGNVELRRLFESQGVERGDSFRFSILEIADVHASVEEILQRESHWKRILLSRSHGLNSN